MNISDQNYFFITTIFIGNILVQIPKSTRGEYFPNLGMLTTLLAKTKTAMCTGPSIEELGKCN